MGTYWGRRFFSAPKLPSVVLILDDRNPIPARHPIKTVHHQAVPKPAHLPDRLHLPAYPAKYSQWFFPRNCSEFGFDEFVVSTVRGIQVHEAKGVDGIEVGVTKKADPELEVRAVAARGVHVRPRFLPQTAPPVSSLLHDVTV